MRKILVVNMNYMGDALLTTPALSALRCAYPDARIDTVVGAGTAADVLRGNPDLNEVIPRTARGSWGRCLQIFRLLRDRHYTDAVILPPLPAYAAAAWLARTPRRVGQAGRGMNRFLTDLRPTRAVHMADAMLDTVPVPPDCRPARRSLTVTVEPQVRERAARLLSEAGINPLRPLIAVNVGATRPQKRWFAPSFAAVIDSLSDVQCVLVGAGDADAALASQVLGLTSAKARPVNLVGKTDVKTLAAVLARCDVLLSADSGPMHLATAVGTPAVALFGSTDPAVTGPYDEASEALYKALPCAPCGNHPTCEGRFDCLRAITPDEVTLSIRSLLRARQGALVMLPQVREKTLTPLVPRDPLPRAGEGEDASSTRRILIVTKFRFIGDTLLAIPIFRAARAQWPQARITLLTGKNARVLLQNNPYLDEIIEFDPNKKERGFWAHARLVARLRRSRFDLCLLLNRSFHSALISRLAGAKIRAGFCSEGRGPLLNRPVDYDRQKSEVACYFDVLRVAAPDAATHSGLELWISEEEKRQAWQRLRTAFGDDIRAECLVGIQPGASQPGKRWDPIRFAQVADLMAAACPQMRFVLIGGPDEQQAVAEMLAGCADETRARAASFAGACDLRASLALVSHLRLFLGNDTAIMHSAVALGVPTVALFGPTNPRKWGNYGPDHRVLESPDGTMASLPAAEVIAAVSELLGQDYLASVPAHRV